MVGAIFTNIVHILSATPPPGSLQECKSVCVGGIFLSSVCVLEKETYCSEAGIKVTDTESWLSHTYTHIHSHALKSHILQMFYS